MAFNLKVIKKDEMSRIHIQNVAKKLQIKGPLGHLNISGKIVLKLILQKQVVK
jgi:hypothetical protein